MAGVTIPLQRNVDMKGRVNETGTGVSERTVWGVMKILFSVGT